MVICEHRIKELLKNTQSELDEEKEGICIESPDNDFNKDSQIGSDSIDLRISNRGYIINPEYKFINTLLDMDYRNSDVFIEIDLNPEKGYDLEPGQVLFINTLERVRLKGDLIGEVVGRSVFSRFGISVHCTQSKFASGMNSIVPLQIRNNINIPLKIFPYQKLVQLVIHRTEKNIFPYNGQYSNEIDYKLPQVMDKDRQQYSDRTKNLILGIEPKKKGIFDRGTSENIAKNTAIYQAIAGAILSGFISLMGFFGISNITIVVSVLAIVAYTILSLAIVKIQK